MSVASLSSEQASSISSIWYSLNLGNPTYAQAVKESDTLLVVMITNDQNINYYAYISKEGVLQEIHVNTEDGTIIYPSN